jgi:hypothetical protein
MGRRAVLLALAAGGLSGCNPSVADYCASGTPECTPADGGAGPDGAGGSEASPDVGGCDPSKSPSEEACVVAETYGVFVSPAGSDSNTGTRSAPVATLGHGMDVAKATGKRVYVCAGSFGEELVIGASRDGVNVYGGLDCAGWTYGAGNRVVVAPLGSGYALELEGLQTGVTLEDLEFDSQSAPSPGASSIAAFASNSQNVVLERVTLVAGTAADGSPAATSGAGADAGATNWFGTPPAYPELNGASASDAGAAPLTTCTCRDQASSTGGAGSGPNNVPPPTAGLPSYGDAGAGVPGVSGNQCNSQGGGSNGLDAPVATTGTTSTTLGSCSVSGWTPAAGVAGADGPPGQGGGGGGDGKVQSGVGGGGACGGCGGAGGMPGTGGGSSIALLAYQSRLTLVDCLLTAKAAGSGGIGGSGEQGQGGGGSGYPLGNLPASGCPGGAGGAGAGGNGGQGGAGGLSLGIGYCGAAPTVDGAVVSGAASLGGVTLGSAGAGAAGGSGGAAATNSTDPAGANGASGPAGVAMAVRSLP